jgi:hypothetical protein
MSAPRVEALIAGVMAKYPRYTPAEEARYYEAVHQELAPLARELESTNAQLYEALMRLRNECDLEGLRDRAGSSVLSDSESGT